MDVVTQKENWHGQYGVLIDLKVIQIYEDAIFSFQ
jgi:hypothetical protein